MQQFKRAQVIILPTKNNSGLLLDLSKQNKLVKYNPNNINIKNNKYNQTQHLYIISDDTWVEKGEWYYDTFDKIIKQCKSLKYQSYIVRKLIATTNTSLFIKSELDIHSIPTQYIEIERSLPQPSQQFIEKYIEEYNKGNIITDVLVEYEGIISSTTWEHDEPEEWKLKINPKDNTITIKKVKDSWNREEVIKIAMDCMMYGYNGLPNNLTPIQGMNKWIEENL